MRLEKISKILIFILIFLFPLVFFPFSQNVLDFPKLLFLFLFTSLSLIFFLIQVLIEGKIKISLHPFHIILISFLFFLFLSSLFSKSRVESFFGIPLSISESFLSFLFLSFFYFLIVNLFEKEDLYFLHFFFSISIFLLLIFSFFQIFGKFILPFDFAKNKGFNLSGNQYSLSILLSCLLPFFTLSFSISKKIIKYFYLLLILISLAFISLINFQSSWLILIIGSIFLLSIFISKREIFSSKILIFPMIYLALSIIFISFNFRVFPIQIPPEANLTQKASFEIALKSFLENPILGTGPATFYINFSKYKPQSLLKDPLFWNVRFSNSVSTFLDIFSTLGALGTISFLFLVFFPLFFGFFKTSSSYFLPAISCFVFAQFLYPFNLTLQFSFFFFLASFFKQISEKEKEFSFAKGKYSPLFISFLLVLIFVLLIINLIFSFQIFAGEIYYFKALKNWRLGKIDETIKYLERAKEINPRFDYYWRDLSQAYLAKVNQKLKKGDRDIQNEIFSAIEAVKTATDKINKNNVANWSVRAFTYQSLFGIATGAEDWAIKCWDEALKLEPKNPYYLTQRGIALLQKQNFDEAKANFEKAIEFKPDYAPAHFQIALLYQQRGEIDKAISKLKETKNLAPFDVGLAFQLGLAYYQKGNYQKAKDELERATLLNPNYANALYFLGLTYDQLGEKEKAIEKFRKVAELNPDIELIRKIIKNLEEGKRALEGISQPSPPQPPVEETPPEIKK
jgi:tetratricopeptide (TPR) repeat protein